eukprot:13516835-Ditylum_brightwellii.AAC.1
MTNVEESIMISLSYAQVVSRSNHPYLKDVSSGMSYVPATWLSMIRTFLAACNSCLKISTAWRPMLQRTQDLSLINTFI